MYLSTWKKVFFTFQCFHSFSFQIPKVSFALWQDFFSTAFMSSWWTHARGLISQVLEIRISLTLFRDFFCSENRRICFVLKILTNMLLSCKSHTACCSQINCKKKVHPKFLQNLLFHIPIDIFLGERKISAIESAT